jgi:hypothetical protein
MTWARQRQFGNRLDDPVLPVFSAVAGVDRGLERPAVTGTDGTLTARGSISASQRAPHTSRASWRRCWSVRPPIVTSTRAYAAGETGSFPRRNTACGARKTTLTSSMGCPTLLAAMPTRSAMLTWSSGLTAPVMIWNVGMPLDRSAGPAKLDVHRSEFRCGRPKAVSRTESRRAGRGLPERSARQTTIGPACPLPAAAWRSHFSRRLTSAAARVAATTCASARPSAPYRSISAGQPLRRRAQKMHTGRGCSCQLSTVQTSPFRVTMYAVS